MPREAPTTHLGRGTDSFAGALFYDEVIPPNTNRGPIVAGGWVRLGSRRPAEVSSRDEVAATLAELQDRTGQQVFTVREVCGEMLAAGTSYAESTVFTTMQRMKAQAGRAPWIILEQTGGGFRLPTQTYGPTYRAGEGTARCLFRLVKARGQAVG